MQWFWINAIFLLIVWWYGGRFHLPHVWCKHFLWVPFLWVCSCWNCVWSIYLNRLQSHKCNLTSDASLPLFLLIHSSAADPNMKPFHLSYHKFFILLPFLTGILLQRTIFLIFFFLFNVFLPCPYIEPETKLCFLPTSARLIKILLPTPRFTTFHATIFYWVKNSHYTKHAVGRPRVHLW